MSVALEEHGEVVLGVVLDPSRDELFAAARGEGAWLGERTLEMRAPERLATTLVATGFSYEAAERERQAPTIAGLLPQVRDIRRAGAAALDLAWLAAGRVDAYFERSLKPWDWAAGGLLVREAGGVTRELPGEPFGIAAGTATIADELYELVVT